MKLTGSERRSIQFIFLVLIVGAIIGTVIFQLAGLVIPEGVVREFFINSITLGIPEFMLDLKVISLTFGFSFDVSVGSVLGMTVAWYFLRFFR